jgi:hypothetical protein
VCTNAPGGDEHECFIFVATGLSSPLLVRRSSRAILSRIRHSLTSISPSLYPFSIPPLLEVHPPHHPLLSPDMLPRFLPILTAFLPLLALSIVTAAPLLPRQSNYPPSPSPPSPSTHLARCPTFSTAQATSSAMPSPLPSTVLQRPSPLSWSGRRAEGRCCPSERTGRGEITPSGLSRWRDWGNPSSSG